MLIGNLGSSFSTFLLLVGLEVFLLSVQYSLDGPIYLVIRQSNPSQHIMQLMCKREDVQRALDKRESEIGCQWKQRLSMKGCRWSCFHRCKKVNLNSFARVSASVTVQLLHQKPTSSVYPVHSRNQQ